MSRQLRMCADAVVTELNGSSWSQSFTAKRVNRPLYSLAQLTSLVVSVMPVTRSTEPASRLDDQVTLRVDVGIQKHFAASDVNNADSDPLIDFGEEICEHFARKELTGADGTSLYQCLRTVYGDEDSPFYDQEHANDLQTFTGVVALTFITFRKVA